MDLDILPDWALRYLDETIAEFAHVINALPVSAGRRRDSFIVNTSRGSVLVRKTRFGEPEHWFLPLPGVQATFTCSACAERMEFVDPEVPRPAYCSRCGAKHVILVIDGALRMQADGGRRTPPVLRKAAGTSAARPTRSARKPAATRAAAPAAKVAPKAGPKPTVYSDYRGDIHPVMELEGIGPKWSERLHGLGVETSARLAYEDADGLAKRLGASPKNVRNWQAMAELVKVNSIGPQYAEALVRGGIRSIAELRRKDAKAIADQVNAYLDGLDVNVLGQRITARRVQGWQAKAKGMRKVRQPVPAA